MYLGIFLGPFSRGPEDDLAVIGLCIEQAIEAAEACFALITFGEQHFNNYEPYCNPFLMGAHLAPHLKHSYFGTTITPLPLHQPIRLAEDMNVLDILTRGKLIVGLSAGRAGLVRDFEAFGLDAADREMLFATKLEIMEKAWAKLPDDVDLTFDTGFDKGGVLGGSMTGGQSRLMPASFRAGRPLYAIGTNSDGTIIKAGEQGHPLFLGPATLEEAARRFGIYHEAMERAGHPQALIDRNRRFSMITRLVIVDETEAKAEERAERMQKRVTFAPPGFEPIVGSPDSVVRQIREYEENGILHLHTRFTVGEGNFEDMKGSFRLFAKECVPQLHLQTFDPPSGAELRLPARNFEPA
jgi:alkanesulfonate monooxygenase SsuD/methylene tetrahydromethanopterin reductase-like flavin-dependent oxidoreductase (luciferase family)